MQVWVGPGDRLSYGEDLLECNQKDEATLPACQREEKGKTSNHSRYDC